MTKVTELKIIEEMSDDFSLANIGGLTGPITALIEKISTAIGVLYKPTDIVRLARAETEAKRISARGEAELEIELTNIKDRAQCRIIHEQENIESILGKAIPLLNDKARPEDVADDWFANFFEYARRW